MGFFKKFFRARETVEIPKEELPEWICGATDAGEKRDHNEDYFLIRHDKNLYIVADGMGGYNAGEVASLHAAEAVDAYFTQELMSQLKKDDEKIKSEINKCLLAAHQRVFDLAKSRKEYHGMGCTIVVALIDRCNLHISHVGDARAYVCDNGGIRLLTTDHSSVMELVKAGKMTMEEARTSPIKNEITQAVGAPRPVVPEYNHYTLKKGDKVLLCSDGLWDMLRDTEIYEILRQEGPAETLCKELIGAANEAGGHDNITVVVIEYKKEELSPEDEGYVSDDTHEKPVEEG